MLNEERVWHDQGTGHVSPVYSDKNNGLSLVVRSETDSKYKLTKTFPCNCEMRKTTRLPPLI